jgi:hypothetical protein
MRSTARFASKNAEYDTGIGPLWERTDLPAGAGKEYVDLVKGMNPSGKMRYYPGSPFVADRSRASRTACACSNCTRPTPRSWPITSASSTRTSRAAGRAFDHARQAGADRRAATASRR